MTNYYLQKYYNQTRLQRKIYTTPNATMTDCIQKKK